MRPGLIQHRHMNSRETAANQLRAFAAMVATVILAAGCGASPPVATQSSPGPTTPSPTTSTSPTPSPTPAQPTYAVHLTLTGGLTGTVTQTRVNASSDCATGKIDVDIVVRGQVWSLTASVDGYHGPGRYGYLAFNLMLSTPTFDIWMSTGGSATYSGDTALSVSVSVTNLMAGPGEPGATAHISGSISCT
jgi:hypothetical protein